MDVTDNYNEYCYNNYYSKSTDWEAYYEHLAQEQDRQWEDRNGED